MTRSLFLSIGMAWLATLPTATDASHFKLTLEADLYGMCELPGAECTPTPYSGASGDCMNLAQPTGDLSTPAPPTLTTVAGPQAGSPCTELQTAILRDCNADCEKCHHELHNVNTILGGCQISEGIVATPGCQKAANMTTAAAPAAAVEAADPVGALAVSFECDGSSTVIVRQYVDEACTEELAWEDMMCGTKGCGEGHSKSDFNGKVSTKKWSTAVYDAKLGKDANIRMKLGELEGCPFYSSTAFVVGGAVTAVAVLAVGSAAGFAVYRRRQQRPAEPLLSDSFR